MQFRANPHHTADSAGDPGVGGSVPGRDHQGRPEEEVGS